MKTLRTSTGKFVSLAAIAAGAVVLILRCANPVDEPPLKWLSRIECPLTNDSFHIAKRLPELMTQFNDTIVRYWYNSSRLPWYRPTDLWASNHARYLAFYTFTDTVTHTITWEKNHVYEWTKKDNVWQWDDRGEVIDILMGGYDSANKGIFYTDSTGPDTLFLDYVKGDTVVMSIPRVDSICYSVTQDSMKTKYFHPTIGSMTIGSTEPAMRDSLKRRTTLLLPAGSVDTTVKVWFRGVQLIVPDASSPPCSVTVRNLSAATVYNCTATVLLQHVDSSSVRSFGTIGPFGSATRTFPIVYDSAGGIYGRGITDTVMVRVQDSATSAPATITVEVNLNGLLATEVTVFSHYITFSKSFINPYELTDTLECHYIDILDGFFIYAIANSTDLWLNVNVSQLHLWRASWCAKPGVSKPPLEKYQDMAGLPRVPDSADNYMGRNVTTLRVGPYGATIDSTLSNTNVNLSEDRLFPEWIYDSMETKPFKMKSVAPVEYMISPYPEISDRTVNIKGTDSLLFTIRAPRFKFKQMLATVRQVYRRSGDMATIEMPFPFSRESKQSLRANFTLKQVLNDLYFTAILPDSNFAQPTRAYLDTLGIDYTLYSPDDPLITAGASTKFVNVINNKCFRTETNITDIMNLWPDSLCIMENIYVPVGTRVMAVNDLRNPLDTDYNKYMGRMYISARTNARTNMVFGWEVGPDTVKLELGYGTFKVNDVMKYFNRMENSMASIDMNVFNHTNLYMNLYGLAGSPSNMDSLQNMPSDTVRQLIRDTASAHQRGYISLLGPRGIRIPARNGTASNRVVLSKWQINEMLKDTSCGWRWEAEFLPMAADTLADTDYVFIQSWIHLEGVNNMDSLLIWH